MHRALLEDRAHEDVTSALLSGHRGTGALGHRGSGAPGHRKADASVVAEERVVVCGVPAIVAAVRELDPAATVKAYIAEGSWAEPGSALAVATGEALALLSAERVALNFVQRLAGVATLTRRCVEAVAGTAARITHTRKTTPGLRELEIYAVVTGGGVPNRASLADAVMWKDNHWALKPDLAESLAAAPAGLEVVVEVENFAQLEAALVAGIRHVLVDNQTPQGLAAFRRRAGTGITIQASGGITEANARAYAEAGADLIAMGCLTHSARAAAIRCDLAVGG